MLGIDTNVVVRLVVSDDADQTRRARKLVERALSRDEPVLVSLLVLLESEWVLRSRYGFNRETLLCIFRSCWRRASCPSRTSRRWRRRCFAGRTALANSPIASSRRTTGKWDAARQQRSTKRQLGFPVRSELINEPPVTRSVF
jgi:hypothetical protein